MKKLALVCMLGLLVSCSRSQGDGMQGQLDSIRVMIKQSALMAANAACGGPELEALVHAAAVMNRRAMGGPEMAAIHRMMGMQPGEGGMPMKGGAEMSPEMRRHVALHDAGEAVFDLLEAISEGKVGCAQAGPVRLAADAAMLRDAGGDKPQEAAHKLDARIPDGMKSAGVPEAVKSLTLALQKI